MPQTALREQMALCQQEITELRGIVRSLSDALAESVDPSVPLPARLAHAQAALDAAKQVMPDLASTGPSISL